MKHQDIQMNFLHVNSAWYMRLVEVVSQTRILRVFTC